MGEAVAELPTDRICNLTAVAEGMRLEGAARVRVLDTASLSAELLNGVGISEEQPRGDGSEALYVIVAGEGLIEEIDGSTVTVTAGDIVFVPAHGQHRFVQQSRKFKTWRIVLAQATHRAIEDA
jgi:mannose-6-phosphate isomerase-like protein (cupin superfamily)